MSVAIVKQALHIFCIYCMQNFGLLDLLDTKILIGRNKDDYLLPLTQYISRE